jgi:hypothetical protein
MEYTKLNYEGFEQYLISEGSDFFGGLAYEFRFENNYGASIIKHNFSYGHEDDLFELAVLYDSKITYSTEITGDVLGYLDNDDVLAVLNQIKELK